LGEQVVEVVARHAPRDRGEAPPDRPGVAVPEGAEVPVDLAPATAPGDDGVDLVVGRRSHPHPEAVIGEYLQPLDVIGGPAAFAVETSLQRVDPAGVRGDVAADSAPGVRGGVRPEPQAMQGGGVAHTVVDGAGLDPGEPPSG